MAYGSKIKKSTWVIFLNEFFDLIQLLCYLIFHILLLYFSLNPIALGDQWLAFADRKLHNTHQSCGGVISESALSYKTSMINVAKTLSKVSTY